MPHQDQPVRSDAPDQTTGRGEPPLAGIRVLELGSFIAGPFAGQLLGDYGAEVIKVEDPGTGDRMRAWGVCRNGQSLWWPGIARNKKSVAIDLRHEEGRALVRRLAEQCDIVLENFTPGRMAEWGLGYAHLAAANPGLILVHVSGFGQDGPRAAHPGFGSVGEAIGGIRHTTGFPDRAPTRTGISLGDSLASLFAVVGSLLALQERARSGRGQEVDVAIYEAVFALMESTLADYELGGVVRGRAGSVLPGVAPSNVYLAADGEQVLIAANADPVFRRLCAAMGRADLAGDERFATHGARGQHMDELDGIIGRWTAELPFKELEDRLEEHGIPFGKINTAADISDDPLFAARSMIIRLAAPSFSEPVPMPGVVPKLSRSPGRIDTPGPALGEHTGDVLARVAGLGDHELARLFENRVVA